MDVQIKNAIGSTEWRSIYGPRITDEYFTSPIGIQFWSEQSVFNNDYPGSEVEVAYPNPQEGWPGFYKLSAGFLLDPTGDINANSTLYRSSIYYQEYSFENDKNSDNYDSIMKSPITGKSAWHWTICANGEISFSRPEVFGPNGNEPKDRCSVVEYKLRVCNTCPDPDMWHDDDM